MVNCAENWCALTGAQERTLIAYADFTGCVRVILRKTTRQRFGGYCGRQEDIRESFQRLYSLSSDTVCARPIGQDDPVLAVAAGASGRGTASAVALAIRCLLAVAARSRPEKQLTVVWSGANRTLHRRNSRRELYRVRRPRPSGSSNRRSWMPDAACRQCAVPVAIVIEGST